MNEIVQLGRGNHFVEIPQHMWLKHVAETPDHMRKRLSFMSQDHHRVRYFVVDEMARMGEPLPPEQISDGLGISFNITNAILDDLQKNLLFLVRNDDGAVSWAYPLTVESTPHRLTFDSGELLYGA